MKNKKIHKRERFYLREKSYLQRVCNRINALIPCKGDPRFDKRYREIIFILREMDNYKSWPHKFDVYFDRDLYIKYSGDSDKIWEAFYYSGMLEVVLTDDIWEHPGIVIRLKPEY